MKLLSFKEYINESYLDSNFAPLYHYTSNLGDIITSDVLKMSKDPQKQILSISTTRSGNIMLMDLGRSTVYRIVLNKELLYDDNYKFLPFDAVGNAAMLKYKHVIKPYDDYRFNPKLPDQNFKQHKSSKFRNYVGKHIEFDVYSNEFEELILSDISPLGKYILSIDFNIKYDIDNRVLTEVKSYIEKYPHIKLNAYIVEGRLVKQVPFPVKYKHKIYA